MQQVAPPTARRQHRLDLGVSIEEHGAHPVAVPGQHLAQDRHHLTGPLVFAGGARAEGHRARQIHHKPRRHLAVFLVLSHIGRLHARGHVPVDVPHIVMGLVFAQIGQHQSGAAKEAAVITLQLAIQTLEHGPFEALQPLLGCGRGG